MLLLSLLLTPILGVLAIYSHKDSGLSLGNIKSIALITSSLNFLISLVIFILFDFSTNLFQFVQEYYEISYFDFYLGVDGLSIYLFLLTTLIIPISLVSNWKSITKDVESYVIIILLLESLLLAVFLVLDILLFYIFFESILPPLFILIGLFGLDNRVKAGFYLFLYTLLGYLFLLLSILAMSSIMSTTDFDTLFKGIFIYLTQLFLFYGIFIAFAVKTPTIFLNTWLLKAHVESPLGGSMILASNYLLMLVSKNLCGNYRVKPHKFITEPLKSDLGISEIITQIDTLLPQLTNFIYQFNTTVSQSGISVITDTIGNMSIDVPKHMSEELANKLTNRIGIIDRLITTRSQDISDLVQKGYILEEKIKLADSQYVSQLTDRMQEYKRLISSYKH